MSALQEPPETSSAWLVQSRPRLAIAETVVASFVLPLVGWITRPEDPFFLGVECPVVVLMPLFPALRYGFGHGFGSAIAVVATMALTWRFGLLGRESFPLALSLLVVVTAMLAGEFTNHWHRRAVQASALALYSRRRLAEFTRQFHVLSASHDRLEQEVAGSTTSLRALLQGVREELLGGANAKPELRTLARPILDLVASYCTVQVASLLEVRDNIEIRWPSCASLGECTIKNTADPLLRECLVSGRMVTVDGGRQPAKRRPRSSELLAVVPIADAYRRVWGLLAIEEMPFASFETQNLTLLSVLGGHIGDLLSAGTAGPIAGTIEEQDFRLELQRAITNVRDHDLPSSLVSLMIDTETTPTSFIDATISHKRGLDLLWITESSGGELVVNLLMPLTDGSGIEGYCARIERFARENYGKQIQQMNVEVRTRELARDDSVDSLIAYLLRLERLDDLETVLVLDLGA